VATHVEDDARFAPLRYFVFFFTTAVLMDFCTKIY